jgi:Tfp pilus assembly protein PilO
MWFWLIKAMAGAIIGNATATWFRFYNKVDSLYNWAAKRYNVKLLTDEEKRMAKFPALKEKLADLESRISKLEK